MTTTISLPQLRISASQVETATQCPRKWWLQSVAKMPTPSSASNILGTVVHSVLDRYFSADDQGRDRMTGKPVDLYPKDWHIARDRYNPNKADGEITPAQQDLVKRLITEAEAHGMLERRPHRMIESDFTRPVMDGVSITGFIDLLHEDEVVDHKTTKSLRYAKSAQELTKNTQMLIYAYELLQRWREACPPHTPPRPDDTITLRHNQFIVDPKEPRVRKVEHPVRVDYIEQFWEGYIKPIAQHMQILKAETKEWKDIPEPSSVQEACAAYGGCPFRGICFNGESLDGYKKRVEQTSLVKAMLDKSPTNPLTAPSSPSILPSVPIVSGRKQPTTHLLQENEMSTVSTPRPSFLNMGQAVAAKAATAPAATTATAPAQSAVSFVAPVASKPTVQIAAAPQTTVVPTMDGLPNDIPPWANHACPTCKGTGFTKAGKPCRQCVATATMRKAADSTLPIRLPDEFTIETPGNGTVSWEAADGDGGLRVIPGQEEAFIASISGKPTVNVKGADPAPIAASEAPPAAEAPAPVAEKPKATKAPKTEPKAETEAEAVEKAKGGRPRKGFILIANAAHDVQLGGKKGSGRYAYRISSLLDEVVYPEACKTFGVQSALEIDVFKRWDFIRWMAPQIAEDFQGDIVIADDMTTGASDRRVFFEAIKGLAGDVFLGYTA